MAVGRRPEGRPDDHRRPDGAAAIAPFENPALATGGTGDVLAGTIGAPAGTGPRDRERVTAQVSIERRFHGVAGGITASSSRAQTEDCKMTDMTAPGHTFKGGGCWGLMVAALGRVRQDIARRFTLLHGDR